MAEHDQQTKLLGGGGPRAATLAGQRQVYVIIVRTPRRRVRGSRIVVDFPRHPNLPLDQTFRTKEYLKRYIHSNFVMLLYNNKKKQPNHRS